MKKPIAIILCLVIFLSGCSAATEESTSHTVYEPDTEVIEVSTEATEPVKEDPFGLSYLPEYGLNPYTCTATANRTLFSLLYEGLFVVTDEFRAEPLLCESFKVSNGGKTYTFTLPEGLRFTDGSPVTSADVEASIAAARKSSMYKHRLARISYYVPDGDRSIVIQLTTPYENFALMMDIPILKADTVESETPIGTGAYVKQGEFLVQNPYWWQTAEPVIDDERIVLSSCETTSDLRDDFEFGNTDLVYQDPNSGAAVSFRCDYEIWEAPTTILHYIGFNLYSGYFANDTLRQGFTYIVDRDEICNVAYGGFAQASVLPCSPSSDLYDPQLAEDYDYAPGSFIEAVQASGVTTSEEYANHVGIFIVCADDPSRVLAAEYLCKELNAYGLNIRLSILDWSSYTKALKSGNYDLYYGEARLTPNFDLIEFFEDNGNLEYGRIANGGLETLCREALENSGSYVELCSQVMKKGQLCPVAFKSYGVYVTRGLLTDFTPAVDFVFHNDAAGRTLSDADQTYSAPEPTESTEASSG